MSVPINPETPPVPSYYTLHTWTMDRFALAFRFQFQEGNYTGEINALGNGVFDPLGKDWEYEVNLLDPLFIASMMTAMTSHVDEFLMVLQAFKNDPNTTTLAYVLNKVDDVLTESAESYNQNRIVE